MAANEAIEQTTLLAVEEKAKLIKSLRRFDMVFFTICAFVGLDTLGQVAHNGPQGFFWLVVLAIVFVAPYMLLMSEVGSAFTQEGGPYEWTKMAVAAYDGAFFPYFGVFNRRLGTPVRVNVLSGITASAFAITAIYLLKNASTAAAFTVVLDIAISTTLISYLWIFPASLRLRYTHPHVHRPYRHPWGMAGIWASTVLVTLWIALGSWVAVFPDTLERVFGVGYKFKPTWGVTQGVFEALTLGTLAVIVVVGLIGYAFAGNVRAQEVDVHSNSRQVR